MPYAHGFAYAETEPEITLDNATWLAKQLQKQSFCSCPRRYGYGHNDDCPVYLSDRLMTVLTKLKEK